MPYFPNHLAAHRATGREDGRCCEKATKAFCVCRVKWKCEEHGETCVGSHD